jgi:pyrroline-5-carboxylate reductase
VTRIGFIGTGHIAAPMARTAARRGHSLIVSERNAEAAAELAREFDTISVAPNQDVLDGSEVVFLCLRPPLARAALEPLSFRADHRVISVMAGVPMAELRRLCAPAGNTSATIPLGFLEQGGCPLPVLGPSADLRALFGETNPVIEVATEVALNRHFAICAMVPGMLAMLETGARWLGTATGDAEAAELYTAQLMRGFLAASEPRLGGLVTARDELATEGTLSLHMVESLEDSGALASLRNALDSIGARLDPPA